MKNITLIFAVVLLAGCGTTNYYSSGDRETGMVRDEMTTTTVGLDGRGDVYPNLAAYLRGRVSGVQVSPDGKSVSIRGGVPSVNATGSPLIIVDGAEMSFAAANGSVLPSDIKSITVDKEGTLYGFRGSHGVIIITTKKGLDE